jgi:hypothetical protein
MTISSNGGVIVKLAMLLEFPTHPQHGRLPMNLTSFRLLAPYDDLGGRKASMSVVPVAAYVQNYVPWIPFIFCWGQRRFG